jgi:MFS transporter, Spinster family, sphingosine-1-phosphate transporter
MSDVIGPAASTPTTTSSARHALRYARYIFWLMFIINFLNYLDRWVFTGLSPIIQKDLKLDDFQVGLLTGAFLLVYTIGALPLGFLADRIARKTIVALGVAIWSVATALTGLANGFGTLFAARAVLGIGEGSYYPAGTPMLAAYYPPARRARVLSRWGVGALIGAAVGFLMASPFSSLSLWRYAFFATGVPGLLFAFLVWRTREKTRHEEDPPAASLPHEGRTALQRIGAFLRIPTVRVIIALHALGFFALTGVTSFLAIYLADQYGADLGRVLGATAAPKLIPILSGAVVLLGGIFGNLAGGALAGRLSLRHSGARVLAGGLGFLFAAPCVVIAVGAPYALALIPAYTAASTSTRVSIGVGIFVVFALLGAFFLNIYNGPVSAALLDVVPSEERGSAGGTELTLAHLLGDVYAAPAIGGIAVLLNQSLGGEQIGLALLLTCPIALVFAGIVGIWGSRFYHRDVEALGATTVTMLGTTSAGD